jgi:hypothetical protein
MEISRSVSTQMPYFGLKSRISIPIGKNSQTPTFLFYFILFFICIFDVYYHK